jgi:hypothetical protein
VAFALAFGLGGREPAQREVERFFQALHTGQIGAEASLGAAPRLDARQRGSEAPSGD